MRLSVAVDGPAGAGKSTIAKLLGDKFNLMYINTGAMYRAVTLFAMRKNINKENVSLLCEMIQSLEMHFECDKLIVNNEDISEEILLPIISNTVSEYAAIPEIRTILVKLQKNMSSKYDVVMDGRDIGTVVLEDATFKFFLTADAEERAKRRHNELLSKGINLNYNTILEDIIKRDYIDTHREANPLTKAKDAIEIDSSNKSIEEVVDIMSCYINKKCI
jgi:cytidylate kinase